MPHLIIDYSRNLDSLIDMGGFCDALRQTAIALEAFPMPGVRVRAFAADHVSIADGNPKHGYIDVSIRLRAGRSHAVKAEAVQQLFETARAFIAPVMAAHPIALSFEIRDIDPDLSPKTGTIRNHL